MTLDEYVQGVQIATGQRDAAAKNDYIFCINRRYEMIYDRLDWIDARQTFSDVTVLAGFNKFVLPTFLWRIISIRAGDHFLDPITSTYLIETDPGMFERSGAPIYYEEMRFAGSRMCRLFPTPTVDTPLLIVGKTTFAPLTLGSDSPIIRNIDNVLLAYAIGDGYQRQRQIGKAKEKYDEGAKLFQELLALEQQQSNVPRTTKQLTVAGNSLLEMTDAVCARCGDWTPPTRILIKEFLRRSYQAVYDLALWPESLVMVRLNSDGCQVILPDYIDRVVALRADVGGFNLPSEELVNYFAVTPGIFEQNTGGAMAYTVLTPVGVAVLPPVRELLSLVSDNDLDKSPVMIRGENAGGIVEESVTLNGIQPVYTVSTYDTPLTVAKGITLGKVTVMGAGSNEVLEVLLPNERERKHMRLWIQPNSENIHNCLLLGKRHINPLIQDEDTPMIRAIANVLISLAATECFIKAGNAAGIAEFKGKADAALKSLLEQETNQQTRSPRVVPYVEWVDDGTSNCFLDKGVFV
jgi:hypothetical protein